MIVLPADRDYYREREVARQCGVHISTVVRWRLRGVRGVRLASFLVGGRRYIERSAFHEFLARINVTFAAPTSVESKLSRLNQRKVDDALDQIGIRTPKSPG